LAVLLSFDPDEAGWKVAMMRKAVDQVSLVEALEDAVPGATTLSRFRIDLTEAGLVEAVFDALNRQLEEHGLVIKAGA
jgi:IS5 family transposase